MQRIEESGIPYTFFYCTFFADSFTRFVENNKVYLFGELPNDIFFTNSCQLAGHIYQAIENAKALNQKYPVQGCESMSFQSAAKRFFQYYDSNVVIEPLPIATIHDMGLPSDEASFLQLVWEVAGAFDEKFVSEKTYQDLGKPIVGIEGIAHWLKKSH